MNAPAQRRWTWRSGALRAVAYQALALVLIGACAWFLAHNTLANLRAHGIRSGFDFLLGPAGFDIGESPIPYEPSDPYWKAIGVGLLMFGTSLAAIGFFRHNAGTGEGPWQRFWAPLIGSVALAVILVVTVFNLYSLLGTAPGSLFTWIPVGVLLLAIAAGLIWAQILRTTKPEIYRNIGVGEQEPLAVLEHALADVKV